MSFDVNDKCPVTLRLRGSECYEECVDYVEMRYKHLQEDVCLSTWR